ncbi:MAG: polyphosphate polymerase domain-containing protein [Planctomycetota bacterium]
MHSDDKTMWCRHELKYRISEAQAAAIVEYIRPHMHPDVHSADGVYPLVSLYLDSDDLRFCHESLDGVKNRYKLRIRSYRDGPDEPCFFEIKRRINQIIVKSRAQVAQRNMAALLAGTLQPSPSNADERRNLEQFLYYQRLTGAGPVMRVRYLRRAFESKLDDYVRVTFDHELCLNVTYTPTVRLNGDGWHRHPQPGVILEIKFTGRCPMWLSRMVRSFGLQSKSIPKYTMLVRQARDLRFLGPAAMRDRSNGTAMVLS